MPPHSLRRHRGPASTRQAGAGLMAGSARSLGWSWIRMSRHRQRERSQFMDAKKFDRLTQAIGAALSRRSALRVALGTTVLGSLGLSRPDVAEAAKCKRKPG